MRLFIALPLPETARTTLEALQTRFPTGRAVPFDNLHLTLSFLGDQSDDTAEAVHTALDSLRAPAQRLTLSDGTIYGGRHGQAIALEADGGADLITLHSRVLSRLRGAGVAPERRRFRPHVTLARMGGRENAGPVLAVLASATVGPFLCDAVSLFSSTLHPDGAIHEELARYPLAHLI